MSRRPSAATSVCLLLPICTALLACAPESDRQPTPTRKSGEEIFHESCGACHGEEGRGPSVAELRALSPEELRAAIRNHPTAGEIPERLSVDRIGGLIEYLEEQE